MHCKQLLEVTERFKSDRVYERTISDLEWSSTNLDMVRNVGIFEDFLGAWHSLRRKLDKENLINVWTKDIEPYARALETESLENLDIEKLVKSNGEKFRVGFAIEHIYGALSTVAGVGDTNASKLLHLRLRHLFVMTDTDIRSIFRTFRKQNFSSFSYAFNFLLFVKSHVNEAINTLCSEKQLTRQQGIEFLQNAHGTRRSLAKLMDECYYVLAHNFEEFSTQPEYFISFLRPPKLDTNSQ